MKHSEKYIITYVIILKLSEIKHVSFEMQQIYKVYTQPIQSNAFKPISDLGCCPF